VRTPVFRRQTTVDSSDELHDIVLELLDLGDPEPTREVR